MKTRLWKMAAGLLLILMSLPAMAQVKFGIKAGGSMNNVRQNYEQNAMEWETRMLFAYHVGVVMDYSFSDVISLQPGVFYARRGFSIDWKEELEGERNFDGFDRTYFDYIDVPVNVAYKFKNVQLFAGPYFSAGIGGKNKMDFSYEDPVLGDVKMKDDYKMKPFTKKISEGDVKDDEMPYYGLDYGVNVGLGFQRGPILINTAYTNGLGNLTPNIKGESSYRKDNKMYNRGINLSVSYFFGE